VVRWLITPLLRRRGWPAWFALAVASCLAIAFEPVRETITFGQVNTLLLALVAGDLLLGVGRGRRWAGVGIGLATAVKLTPGVFILYLLVTRRWRAAFTAMGTAAAATLAAAVIFPDQSWEFWTSALWDPGRVGDYWYLSNQSVRGFVARLPFDRVESYLWIVLVLVVLASWYRRVRAGADDLVLGLALTGVLGCLISPITWVHHCVWLLPALVRCAEAGLSWPARRGYLYLAGAAYLVMTSRLTWLWESAPQPPLALLGSNLYVYFSLAFLIWTPASAAGDVSSAPGRSSPAADIA
jgi:alpha-1,2-mannosyltransferase